LALLPYSTAVDRDGGRFTKNARIKKSKKEQQPNMNVCNYDVLIYISVIFARAMCVEGIWSCFFERELRVERVVASLLGEVFSFCVVVLPRC
jgi:hypothetical protein